MEINKQLEMPRKGNGRWNKKNLKTEQKNLKFMKIQPKKQQKIQPQKQLKKKAKQPQMHLKKQKMKKRKKNEKSEIKNSELLFYI